MYVLSPNLFILRDNGDTLYNQMDNIWKSLGIKLWFLSPRDNLQDISDNNDNQASKYITMKLKGM